MYNLIFFTSIIDTNCYHFIDTNCLLRSIIALLIQIVYYKYKRVPILWQYGVPYIFILHKKAN